MGHLAIAVLTVVRTPTLTLFLLPGIVHMMVAAGSFLAGIPGALFAVPVIAVANVMVKYIAGGDWKTNPRPKAEDILPNA